jgi:hypothetical protein
VVDLADMFPQASFFGGRPPIGAATAPGSQAEQDANRAQFQNDPAPSSTAPLSQQQQALLLGQIIQLLIPGWTGNTATVLQLLQQLMGANPVYADDMVSALLQLIRRTNITAAQPAHNQQTYWSQTVDLSGTVSIPATVGGWTTVCAYTPPPGYEMRLANYGLDVDDDYTYDGSLLWRITVNGLAAPSLSGFAEHRGSLANPRQTYAIVLEDQPIHFDVMRAVASGGANDVTMALGGWSWRKRMNYEGTRSSVTAY